MNTSSKKGSHLALRAAFNTGATLIVRHRTHGQRLRGPCPCASSPCKEAAWLSQGSGSGRNCPLWRRWQQGLGAVKKDLTNLLISSFEPPWIISEIFRGTFFMENKYRVRNRELLGKIVVNVTSFVPQSWLSIRKLKIHTGKSVWISLLNAC